ncbi:MAG: EAL domain-containing protein [Granulosicoccaceae bacterium]
MNVLYKEDNTKTIITLGFFAVLALMITVVAVAIATMESVNSDMSALIKDTEQKTSRAYQMRDVIRLRSGAVRSLLQIQDPDAREKIFDQLVNYTITYEESRQELIKFGANEREQEILDKIAEADGRGAIAYNKTAGLIFNMQHVPSALKTALAEVRLQELVLLNHLNELVKLEKLLSEEALEANQETYKNIQKLMAGLVIAAILVSILIAGFVIQRVTEANRKIAHQASHDDLTGLFNRRSFEQQLIQVIGHAQRSVEQYGLLYIDLDRFKIVNDTCGHHAGDKLLIELTTMIKERIRQGDMFARLGGDEFAIIASGKSFDDVVSLAEELRSMISEYIFAYEDQKFQVSLSIGVLPIYGDVTDIEAILTDVDSACYVAKKSGRNRVHVTQENDAEVVRYRDDIAGIQSIRSALAEDRLTLFYQPVYFIGTDNVQVAHCEILLRINDEDGSLLSPAKFIPVAEKYNIMTEIDRWVVSHVLDWIKANQKQYELPHLLINLSGLSFIDDEFLEYVMGELDGGEVDARNIAFEITETAAVDNLDKANVFIDKVGSLGSKFALDDFGSGFSTFAYLKSLPIDYLKIDGSLVKNMATDTVDREMVKAINEIGHTVGAETIAEFVEDDETLEQLRIMGVDYAQGFGLAKPSALKDMVDELDLPQHSTNFRKAS